MDAVRYALQEILEPSHKQVRQSKTPAYVGKLPPAAQGVLTRNLPKPTSREQLEQLPPGTEYIAPDGSLRRKK